MDTPAPKVDELRAILQALRERRDETIWRPTLPREPR
jgi:hypothetical protein